jgi:TRAP-type C4-dicarboxylate transport system substrate-binding protein
MDIAFGVQSYTPGRFPLTEALELPFLWTSAAHATHALQSIYAATPALQAEYADTHLLAIFANGPAHVMTTRRQIKTLEDLQGLKLRSPGAVHNKVIEALGAAPLSMPASEQYDALERGVVNGTIIAPSALTSFNLADVIRYTANARFTVSTFFVTMNRARYEGLSISEQQIIDASAERMLAARAAGICDTTEAASAAIGLTRGVVASELPTEELERWRAATRHVSDEWVRSHEASGAAVRGVYEQVLHLAQAGTQISRG